MFNLLKLISKNMDILPGKVYYFFRTGKLCILGKAFSLVTISLRRRFYILEYMRRNQGRGGG
jgi:hypothetical protein